MGEWPSRRLSKRLFVADSRQIFILEGIVTVVVGAAGKFLIVDWPEKAKFLSEEEKRLLIARLSADVGDAKMNTLNKRSVYRIFSDWKMYLGTLMYFGVINTGYATSFFTPQILTELGYKAEKAQVRSIPIFIVAACVAITVAWFSDRLRHRYAFIIAGCCTATIGYVILICQHMVSVQGRYGAVFLIVSGGYMAQPVTLGWTNNTMAGHWKRSLSSAFQVGFGNLGGIVASNIFITSQAPEYPVGYGVSLGLIWLCALSATGLFAGLWAENKKRARGERDERLDLPDADNLGDDHPHFRFTY